MMEDDPYSAASLRAAPRIATMGTPDFQTMDHNSHRSPSLHSPLNRSEKSRSGESRFSSSASFEYNARIAIALVPCALLLVEMGGFPVMATLTVGIMISYILDAIQLKQGAFFGIWSTLIISQFAFLAGGSLLSGLNSWPLYVIGVLVCFEANFLIGVWASLQFRWLQLENPSIVMALERILFACVPFTASVIWTWGAVAAVGMDHAAYYLMVILSVFYWLYSMPRQSSFRTKTEKRYGGQIVEETLILGALEGTLHTLGLLFLPLLFYIGSHHSVIFSSMANVCDLFLLFFLPFLFQLYASNFGALWWISKDPAQLQQIRIVNGAIALVVVTVCLEIRVVFYSFGRYLHVAPPWNYVLVTITMLGGASAAGAYGVGLVSSSAGSVVFTGMSILVSVTGSIVVGVPLKFLPAPIVAGFYISQFFTKKSLSSYFIFVISASLPFAWFVVHNYWNLNIWLAGMALKSFCKYIIVSTVLAMVIPGLALLPSKVHIVTEIGLISHALMICYIENKLYTYSSIYYFGIDDDVMYPSYMVITTTVLGLALVRRLALDNRIGPKAVWILTCLYAAKLSMLFLTFKSVLWVAILLLLAISPPLLLYKEKGKAGSKMKPWQAFSHAAVITLSVWYCRNTIFEVLQWWNGRPPSDGLVLGFIILLSGLGCFPIVSQHFSHILLARRVLLLVVVVGVLLIYLQPPLPEALTFKSSFMYIQDNSVDDITIYGLVEKKASWPSWLLIGTIMFSLAAVTKIIPVQYIVELRILYSVGIGITLGIYICVEFFIQAPILHALLVGAVTCTSVFVVFTHLPSSSSPRFLPWVFALLVALLPVMYLIEGQLRLTTAENGEEERFVALLALEGARISLLGLYAAIFMLIALEIKFELSSLMRDKVLEKGGLPNVSNQSFVPKYRLLQQRRASMVASFTVKKLAAEGAWMPAVGNVAAGLCFLLCLILNVHLSGGSNRAIFILAPILLLLNQDSNFITGFGDRQRYFPLTAVISLYLVASSIYKLWDEVWHGYAGWGLETGGPGWFFVVKNTALLMLTLPNHILFNRFMWDYARQSDLILLLIMPLNLPSVVMTDIIAIKILALLGIMYALIQYLVSRHIRIKGMRFI
uniref:No exine fromation 1 n=1 Tax=Cupressus sempervirens TaxID=13469 RepID=A0A3Q8C112_CUPSE|nr:no exine fromation 1 [Cupressus sempervirens]